MVGSAILGALSGLYDKFLMNPDGPCHGQDVRPELVQHLPVRNDGRDDDAHLVSQPKENHTIPLALVNHIHLCIPECRRLRLSLRLVSPGSDDLCRLDDPPRQRHRQLPLRRPSLQRKNLRSKAIDLARVLLGMVFLYLGSR